MCLGNTGWRPPYYLHSPPSVPHLTVGNSAVPFCLSVCLLLSLASLLSPPLTHMLIHFVGRSQSTFKLFIEHDWDDIKLPVAKQTFQKLPRLFFNKAKFDPRLSTGSSCIACVCRNALIEIFFFVRVQT